MRSLRPLRLLLGALGGLEVLLVVILLVVRPGVVIALLLVLSAGAALGARCTD